MGSKKEKRSGAKKGSMEMGTELNLKIYQEFNEAGRKAPGRENRPDTSEKVGMSMGTFTVHSREAKGVMRNQQLGGFATSCSKHSNEKISESLKISKQGMVSQL